MNTELSSGCPLEFALSIILFAAALRVMYSLRIWSALSEQLEENPRLPLPIFRNGKATDSCSLLSFHFVYVNNRVLWQYSRKIDF